VNSGDQVDPAC